MIGNRYGPGSGWILLDDVRCVGNETSIFDCPYVDYRNHNCDHDEDVSVMCGASPVGLHYGNFDHAMLSDANVTCSVVL